MKSNFSQAYFAGGCFWGVEYHFQNLPGVITTKVGYMGGNTDHPTYEEVSTGQTGHAEVLEVTFDDSKTTYETLARLFFEIHDPTQLNRQGPDRGEQYRSAIFYVNNEQKTTAEKLIKILQNQGYAVVTKIIPASHFWEAEDYHQQYYAKSGQEPYCHIRTKKFK